MSRPLQDPNLPPGAIVEKFEDGGAMRNDGVRLTAARDNPWYVLATVYEEQEGRHSDLERHAKNRRIWNGWMCQGKSSEERAQLAEKVGLPLSDLDDLTAQETADLDTAWHALCARCPDVERPAIGESIDMSEIHFSNTVVLEKCIFSGDADFSSSTFSGDAIL